MIIAKHMNGGVKEILFSSKFMLEPRDKKQETRLMSGSVLFLASCIRQKAEVLVLFKIGVINSIIYP